LKKYLIPLRVAVFIIAAIGALYLYSCGNKQNDEAGLKQIQFNIDPNTLAGEVSDSVLKFLFKPPKDWKLIDEKLFKKVEDNNDIRLKQKGDIRIIPLYIFMDDSLKCLLNISQIQFNDKGKTGGNKSAEYEKALLNNFGKEKLKRAEFLKDDLPVIQYMLNDKGKVNFKILISNKAKELIQFDYVTDFGIYPKEIKAIESSIGSIQLLK